jgi:hypothetical protein
MKTFDLKFPGKKGRAQTFRPRSLSIIRIPYSGAPAPRIREPRADRAEVFPEKCKENDAEVIFFIAYSSDQCRLLDLPTFS